MQLVLFIKPVVAIRKVEQTMLMSSSVVWKERGKSKPCKTPDPIFFNHVFIQTGKIYLDPGFVHLLFATCSRKISILPDGGKVVGG